MMRMVLYTRIRRGELFRLQWDHIDTERGFIRLVNPKGGIESKIPLNGVAKDLLANHPRLESSQYVFPGRGGRQRVDMYTLQGQIALIFEKSILDYVFKAFRMPLIPRNRVRGWLGEGIKPIFW